MVSLLCVSCGEAWGPVWLYTISYALHSWRVSTSHVSVCVLTTDVPWWTASYTPPHTCSWQGTHDDPHRAKPGTCIGLHEAEFRTHWGEFPAGPEKIFFVLDPWFLVMNLSYGAWAKYVLVCHANSPICLVFYLYVLFYLSMSWIIIKSVPITYFYCLFG